MNWHKIDFRQLAMLLTSPMLRKPTLLAYLYAAIAPIATLYVAYIEYRRESNYKLTHNGQVCHLQAVLNDMFDLATRGIYITDTEVREWTRFLWKESEDKPIMLGVFLLNKESLIGADTIDFVVHLPARLNLSIDDMARLHALILYYKLASKRYIIISS